MSRNRSASSPRPLCAAAAPALSAMPVRSAPAQKALSPAPESTTTRTSSSARADAIASRRPLMTPYDIALRRSGRLIVTRATPPAASYSSSSVIADPRSSPDRTRPARYRGRVMLVLGIAMLAALLVPLVTHGSYKRLLGTKVSWAWMLGVGLAIQIVLEFASPPRRYWHN